PARAGRPDCTPRSTSRASSSPLTTSTRWPVARCTAATNAPPFAASRTALVARHVVAHDGERAGHRRLPERAGSRESLAEPRHGLPLVDHRPARGADHIGDEETDRVGADIDRRDTHAERRTPRRITAGRVEVDARELLSLERADVVHDLPEKERNEIGRAHV